MGEAGKTREELLAEWKEQKSMRGGSSLRNLTNNPAGGATNHPGKPSVTFAEPEVFEDKENPEPVVKPVIGATPVSLRKAALPAPHREQMEQQFDLLQGRLHAIKRDSRRPSISGIPLGAHNAAAMPTPTSLRPSEEPAAAPQPIDGLAAKLESLKREAVRPSFASAGGAQVQFEAAGQYDMQALSRLAQQLFGDKEFSALCEKGMKAELTRSKDGATDETKIKELAGTLIGIIRYIIRL